MITNQHSGVSALLSAELSYQIDLILQATVPNAPLPV